MPRRAKLDRLSTVPHRTRISYHSELSRRISRDTCTNSDAWLIENASGVYVVIEHRRGNSKPYAWRRLWRVVPAYATCAGRIVNCLTLQRHYQPVDGIERYINGRWADANGGRALWQSLHLREIHALGVERLPGTKAGRSTVFHYVKLPDWGKEGNIMYDLVNHYQDRAKRVPSPALAGLGI